MRKLAGALLCAVVVVATGPLARAEALAPAKPEEVGLSSERLARIGKVFGQEIDQGRLPGVVVAIARKGKLAYYESFGSATRVRARRCRRMLSSASTR